MPLRATDKRRQGRRKNLRETDDSSGNGTGKNVGLFNDRRKNLGHGKRAR